MLAFCSVDSHVIWCVWSDWGESSMKAQRLGLKQQFATSGNSWGILLVCAAESGSPLINGIFILLMGKMWTIKDMTAFLLKWQQFWYKCKVQDTFLSLHRPYSGGTGSCWPRSPADGKAVKCCQAWGNASAGMAPLVSAFYPPSKMLW